jgi:WXXGXW repeat (2 copies)
MQRHDERPTNKEDLVMHRSPFIFAVAAAFALPAAALTSASDARAMPAQDAPHFVGQEVILIAPPVEIVETVGVAPSPRHFWVRGYHRWNGAGHVWVPGRWEVRREGFRWVDAYWERREHGWRFHEGVWIRL